jgi:ATP-dependent DNA helicase UvrD/PcrA
MSSHLNSEQRRAVETTEGRVLILAGAGSGKTSVLTHRIAYLIDKKGVPPEQILGLTFTNKAAREMRHRVEGLVGKAAAKKITLSTFHSFCMKILRKEIDRLGYTKEFTLYDERDVKRVMTQLTSLLLEHQGELPSLQTTMAKISHARSRGVSPEELSPEKASWHDKFTQELFTRLHSCMRAYNAVDFDSLLSLTIELFEKHPDVLERYRTHFRYIMIDEYQDTNPIQYQLAALLSSKHNNLCVVGDDDQSIYSWRGAEIKNILNFESHHVIKLEQNYRSTPHILHAANSVIKHNSERHEKTLWSAHEMGEPITLFHAPTEVEEANAIVRHLIAYKKEKNLKWREMAILYRSNILAQPLELALMQATWEENGKYCRGIPYEIFGGLELFERSEIKDLLAYLRLIANPLDQEALLRIINVPRRGISDQTLDILTQINRKNNMPLWEVLRSARKMSDLSERALKAIDSFITLIEEGQKALNHPPLYQQLCDLAEKIDFQQAIKEEVKSEKMRAFKMQNIEHFLSSLEQYENQMMQDGRQDEISLCNFLSEVILDQEQWQKNRKNFSDDKISLMTFHGSKGLEFPACFLVGLEDHIIPHEKSLSEGSLEEERRLMYVAMTRAQKYLTLSMAKQRKRMGKEMKSSPSRFLFEIPKDLLKIVSWHV